MRRFYAILSAFLVVFGSANMYVGLRGWEWLRAVTPVSVAGWVYWAPFGIVASAFPLSRLGARLLPRTLTDALTVIGAYWMPVLLYALPLLWITDAGRVLSRWLGFAPGAPAVGGAVLLLLALILLYGVWRARTPVVTRYDVTIPKSGGDLNELHIALVSDTHFGAINGLERVRSMVRWVNGLKPDLILVAGDVIDDDLPIFASQNMAEGLRGLKARLGAYAVLGNHDSPAGHLEEYRRQMDRAGIHLLVDERVKVADSFYVIGRNDISGRSFAGRSRKPLGELLRGVDASAPLILMDHQPNRLAEAQEAGIDLQVSGHTHRGQLFPFHFITGRVFEVDWGYLKKGALHVIVSLGFGTWGPPVRIGNRPEVVSIRVRFAG